MCLVGYLGIFGLLSMKAALEVATIIATITKNAAIVECFPPLSPTISPRVTPSETSLRATFVFVFCQASCFSQKESRRCCCPSDRGHLCLQALARPKTSSQSAPTTVTKQILLFQKYHDFLNCWSKYPQDSLQVIFVHISTLRAVGRRRLFESPLQHNLCTLYTRPGKIATCVHCTHCDQGTQHSCDTTVCRLSGT